MAARYLAIALTLLALPPGFARAADTAPAPRPALTGAVRGPDNKPVAGATVAIYTGGPRTGTSTYCPSCYPDCVKSATTDAAGTFTIRSLDPGLIFRVLVVAEGFTPQFVPKVDPAKGPIAPTLKPTDPTRLKPGHVLRGRVLDPDGNPVFGASVSAFGMRNSPTVAEYGTLPGIDPLAVTNTRGEFALTTNEAGLQLVVRVEARGYLRVTSPFLPVGDETHVIRMRYGVTVRGRVVHNGKPVPGAAVGVVQANRRGQTFLGHQEIATDADGKFAIQNVNPDDDHYVYGLMDSLKGLGALPAKKVRAGADRTDLDVGDLEVKPGFQLAGRVVLADGKAVPPGTRAWLSRREAWDSQIVVLGPNGEFSFEGLSPEGHSFSVDVRGYRFSRRNESLDTLNLNDLVGRVAGDDTGLRVLLEPGEPEERDHSKRTTREEAEA